METNEYLIKDIEDGKKVFLQESFRVDHPFRLTRQIFGPNVLDTEGYGHLVRKREWNKTFGRKNIQSEKFQEILRDSIVKGKNYAINNKNLFLMASYIPNKVVLDMLGCADIDPIEHLTKVQPLVHYLETGEKLEDYFKAKEYVRDTRFYDSSEVFRDIPEKDRENDLSLLVGAGVETTIVSMEILLTAWATKNESFHEAIEKMGINDFVLNLLDSDPPLGIATKYCSLDTELDSVSINKGDIVHISIPDANSGSKCPIDHYNHSFDRTNEESLTFGLGRHHCPGHLLAKAELKLLAEELLTLDYDDFNITFTESNYQRPVNFRHPAPLIIAPKQECIQMHES